MTHLLGLDLGTSSIKALLVTETGQIAGSGSAEYAIHRHGPDQAEQDPEAWSRAAASAAGSALSGASNEAVSVAAIGVCGQTLGTVLLDHKGQVYERILDECNRSEDRVAIAPTTVQIVETPVPPVRLGQRESEPQHEKQ